MTGMSSSNKPIVAGNEFLFANELYGFFCYFDFAASPEKCVDLIKTIIPTEAERIVNTLDEVRCMF